MALFRYRAIKGDGREFAGTQNGATVQEVEQWLVEQGFHPIEIEVTGGLDDGDAGAASIGFWQRLHGVSIDDRILLCRQVATMLGAGVPILQALQIMARQATNPIIADIVKDVADRIEEGENLSDAFNAYPRFTSPLLFNLVRVGEETGTLDQSFLYLAELYENQKDVEERIKAATRYPKIVITAIFAAVFFLMSFVVPKFMVMFANAKVELPLPTKILIAVSSVASSYFWYILVLLAVVVLGYRYAMEIDEFRLVRDRLWLRVPVFGDLSLKIYMSRFARVFSVLHRSGVNVIRTLELSATALENLMLFETVDKITGEVREGVEINQAMAHHQLFPEMVVQMMAIGEEAGQVDQMMEKVAEYYEKETNYTIKNLSTFIEPLLLLVMGVFVGFLALAIYMPMWDMMNVMRR